MCNRELLALPYLTSTSQPLSSTRCCTMSTFPDSQAKQIGISWLIFLASILHWGCAVRNLTISKLPFSHAMCNGVLLGYMWSLRLISNTPMVTRYSVTSTQPNSIAICSG